MKNKFKELRNYSDDLSIGELFDECVKLASEIVRTDESMLSVSKRWASYGTWASVGFANNHYFGDDLAAILKQALSNRITHDEDKVFVVLDFEEAIIDNLFEKI